MVIYEAVLNKAEHTDTTSAADKAIGFDFQYYYFLNELLNLKTGQVAGLEVMDDVHTELSEINTKILIQLKHTVQRKADGTPINLTALDSDLWKTLYNWTCVITDVNAGRHGIDDQMHFLSGTTFLLASNKSENLNNKLLLVITEFQNSECDFEKLIDEIKAQLQKTKSADLKKYIKHVLSLDRSVLEEFFKRVAFDLGCEDIIQKCKTSIKEKHVPEERIDDVFRAIDSQLRTDNFIKAHSKVKIEISFDEFHLKYRLHFDYARNKGKLPIRRRLVPMPDRLEEQKFIEQLVDIEDFPADDVETMAIYTKEKLMMQNNLHEWLKNSEITETDMREFESECKKQWSNQFRKSYRRSCGENEMSERAREVLDAMREVSLPIAGQSLPTEMSNGELYSLSDETPTIGWRKDWKDRYK